MIPAALTIVLTPEICVETDSIPDLISSFTSGRLYTQCELMSVHYKHPVFVIEFEEDKAFLLEVVADMKSYVKPSTKYPPKKPSGPSDLPTYSSPTIQSKIVLDRKSVV